jgi:hypothetical protein
MIVETVSGRLQVQQVLQHVTDVEYDVADADDDDDVVSAVDAVGLECRLCCGVDDSRWRFRLAATPCLEDVDLECDVADAVVDADLVDDVDVTDGMRRTSTAVGADESSSAASHRSSSDHGAFRLLRICRISAGRAPSV